MTPGFLLGLGTQIFWKSMGQETSLWHTALGTNTVWGIPFGFLVMIGDLEPLRRPHRRGGARPRRQRGEDVRRGDPAPRLDRHLRSVPVRLHADLERLRSHGAARARQPDAAARDRRPDPGCRPPARSLRPRHGDDARLAGGDRHVPGRARRSAPGSGGRRCRASRRSWASAAGSTPRPQSRSSRGTSDGDRLKPVPDFLVPRVAALKSSAISSIVAQRTPSCP